MKKRLPYILLLCLFQLLLLQSQSQEKNDTRKCLDCHKKTVAKKFIHEPTLKACDLCHISNGSPHPTEGAKGFTLIEKMPQLCYKCHDPQNNKETVHHPVKKGQCIYCHELHSSNVHDLLVSPEPDLCFVCHDQLEKKINSSSTVHSVSIKQLSCSNCHSPHQSRQKKLLWTDQKELCLECHSKPVQTPTHIVRGMRAELEKNKFIHGAITENGCSGCHEPHAGKEPHLLTEMFQTSIYIPGLTKDPVALCFKCHKPELLTETTTANATKFRNGTQNLHAVHVNRVNGRNCTNCHNVHAAPNKHLLVDQSAFGNWKMPLIYQQEEKGGRCVTACHTPRTYIQ